MYNPLAITLWSSRFENHRVQNIFLAILGSIVLAISAKIAIPFYPVPLTTQTFVLLVMAMAYGWRLGTVTILLYLAEGMLGLPVFSGTPEKGIGLAYMMGSTGGYLFGFVLATMLCGYLAERGWDRTIATTGLAMLLGNVVIYIPGLLWLGILLGWDKPILAWGLTPFILGDLTKIVLATALFSLSWRFIKQKNTMHK